LPKSLKEKGWITQSEAIKLLGLEEGKLISWDYITAEQWEDGDKWVKLKSKYESLKPEQKSPDVPKKSIKPKNDGRPSFFGIGTYSVAEAAEILGLTENYVRGMARNNMNAFNEHGRLWIPCDEVEWYQLNQERWRSLGGRWTPYGREPKLETLRNQRHLQMQALERYRGSRYGDPVPAELTPEEEEDDRWVRASVAAQELGLSEVQVHRYGADGRIKRKLVREGSGFKKAYYSLRDVYRFERAKSADRLKISVELWRHDLRHPTYFTELVPGKGDRLITRREAARILGCSEPRVSEMVIRGYLFGYKEYPGKPGCPLFLSERQIERVASDPDRLERKARRVKNRQDEDVEETPGARSSRLWRRDNGIPRDPGTDRKDHGDFYSTGQAAETLRISRTALSRLRKRGKLRGYRHPIKIGRLEDRRWWFYRKEDIDKLAADPEYIRLRDRGKACSPAPEPHSPSSKPGSQS
jgi:hypothetical protein